MRGLFFCMSVIVGLSLGACEATDTASSAGQQVVAAAPAQPNPEPTVQPSDDPGDQPNQQSADAAGQSRWLGTFSGSWDGMCDRQAPGSFQLVRFDGSSGRVEWTWNCGRQQSIRRSARLEGDVLVVDLRGRREARYRFIDDNTVEGELIAPDIPARYLGTFTRS